MYTGIESGVFCGCTNLEEIVLPDTLESLGAEVFFGCKTLMNFILPAEVEEILQNAQKKICAAHASVPFEKECGECRWFQLCKTGCPFVKKVNQSGKSYTCQLQQQ